MNNRLWNYKATIARWIDGDTVEVTVDLGFYTYRKERLRLVGSILGVDTPELSSKYPAVVERAKLAHKYAITLAPPGSEVIVITSRPVAGDTKDGFGRFLAQVIVSNGVNVGDALLSEGLAEPYAR